MKDIQRTIDRYLAGETTPQEESRLAMELSMRRDLPREWQAVREMLGELAAGEAEYDAILAGRESRVDGDSRGSQGSQEPRENRMTRASMLIRFGWAAACVAAVALGIWTMRSDPETESQATEIAARVEPFLAHIEPGQIDPEHIEPEQQTETEAVAQAKPKALKTIAIASTKVVESDVTQDTQQPVREESSEQAIAVEDENLARFMQFSQSIQQRGERLTEMAEMMSERSNTIN